MLAQGEKLAEESQINNIYFHQGNAESPEKGWMNLTDTPEDTQKEITDLMKADLSGGSKTGFSPYIQDNQIVFDHRWLLLIGEKNKFIVIMNMK